MDELEISGKRYISSRRAAKENKYHTDYIGQLIRAGRIAGTKVGRAWYVEVDSLEKYLRGDFSIDSVERIGRPDTDSDHLVSISSTTARQDPLAEPKEKATHPISTPEDNYIQEKERQKEVSIPIKKYTNEEDTLGAQESKRTLQYVYDDSPLMPEILSSSHVSRDLTRDELPPRGSYAGVVTLPTRVRKARKNIGLAQAVALGSLILTIVAVGSAFVTERRIVESGKTATVGYIFLQ